MAKIEIDKCPICSSQEESVTNLIIPRIRSLKLKKNTSLLEQGEAIKGLYLIHTGKVKVSKISQMGKEVVLEFLGPGKTFGEASLLGPDLPSDHLTIVENSEIYFIPKEDFKDILKERPELYQSVVGSLIRWMDRLNSIIENIAVSSAKERVIKYLLEQQIEQGAVSLELKNKKHEVALMLGLRPETFSRTLAEMEQEGLLKLDHRKIIILQSL